MNPGTDGSVVKRAGEVIRDARYPSYIFAVLHKDINSTYVRCVYTQYIMTFVVLIVVLSRSGENSQQTIL